MNLSTKYSDQPRAYTGVELRPHFILSELKVQGPALVAFVGSCRVETEHLVDWEDRLVNDRIEAAQMVHFLGEFFGMGLREGVFAQRLLMAIMGEVLREKGIDVRRSGDDLFIQNRKLSVSIVTASPVSVLLHAGINIDPAGAPVPAIGLGEIGIDPVEWTQAVLAKFLEEYSSVDWACAKVRPVI